MKMKTLDDFKEFCRTDLSTDLNALEARRRAIAQKLIYIGAAAAGVAAIALFVIVQSGDTFSKLVEKVYGLALPEYVEWVQRHNPDIKDINRIEIGQKILFPELSEIKPKKQSRNH